MCAEAAVDSTAMVPGFTKAVEFACAMTEHGYLGFDFCPVK